MKLVHISDLHIGKRLNNYSLTEDQKFILDRILEIVSEEKADGVIIAGDIYDRSIPPEEAVTLFDDFLVELSSQCRSVFIISGNHDSSERLAFGSRLINKCGIYISPVFNGKISPVTLTDEYGDVDFYLLPFIKPAHVRPCYPDAEIKDYTDALRTVIENLPLKENSRNVMVAHQFVTGASQGGSEESFVGGLENVDSSVFAPLDYTALGHIHKTQTINGNIRYCGSPLKYSFSEIKHKKSVTVVELKEKGSLDIREIPLTPMREMAELKGTFKEVIDMSASIPPETYLRITLTDKSDIPNAMNSLLSVYPFLMKLEYENTASYDGHLSTETTDDELKDPLGFFERFYASQTGSPMDDEQRSYVSDIINELWGGTE